MEEKDRLRTRILAARDSISVDERERRSAAACRNLERLLAPALERPLAGAGEGPITFASKRFIEFTGGRPVDRADERPSALSCEQLFAPALEHPSASTGKRPLAGARDEAENVSRETFGLSAPETRSEQSSLWPVVAVYSAMKSEVDLTTFIEAAYSRRWNVCFPCMVKDEKTTAAPVPATHSSNRSTSSMAFYLVQREQFAEACDAFLDHPLRCLTCATLEQAGFQPVAPASIDAVVVPLVAFDNQGNRLGYGGGNYDQLLPQLRADAAVVGIAFAEQRAQAIPLEPHDHPLPHIVVA